jgi:hypothetical protein
MLMMPITTTVVTYHLHGAKRRLFILLGVGSLSIAAVIAVIAQRRDPIVSYETRARLELRTIQMAKPAHECQIQALEAAWKYVRKNPQVVEQDGKITGEALEVARKILDDGIYKPDESYAFDLYAAPQRHPQIIILYYKATRGRSVVWVAIHADGHEIKKKSELGPELLTKLKNLYGE